LGLLHTIIDPTEYPIVCVNFQRSRGLKSHRITGGIVRANVAGPTPNNWFIPFTDGQYAPIPRRNSRCWRRIVVGPRPDQFSIQVSRKHHNWPDWWPSSYRPRLQGFTAKHHWTRTLASCMHPFWFELRAQATFLTVLRHSKTSVERHLFSFFWISLMPSSKPMRGARLHTSPSEPTIERKSCTQHPTRRAHSVTTTRSSPSPPIPQSWIWSGLHHFSFHAVASDSFVISSKHTSAQDNRKTTADCLHTSGTLVNNVLHSPFPRLQGFSFKLYRSRTNPLQLL